MTDAIEAGARAMKSKRLELENQPLARIYPDLSKACIEAAIASGALVPASAVAEMREMCVRAIPNSWLDPLLSGPSKVGTPPFGGNTVEKLLRSLQDRIRQLDLSQACGDYVVGWRTMDSAPRDGKPIAVICWWPSYVDDNPGQWGPPKTYAYEQEPRREQCWTDSHRTTCIREDRWIERYRWAPLPVELPPPLHAATRTWGGK